MCVGKCVFVEMFVEVKEECLRGGRIFVGRIFVEGWLGNGVMYGCVRWVKEREKREILSLERVFRKDGLYEL